MRRLLAIALLIAVPVFAQRRHAALPPPPYDPPPPIDVFSAADIRQVRTTHVSLDLQVDFAKSQVRGSATETIENLAGAAKFIVDTRDLEITRVTIDNVPTTWSLGSFSTRGRPLSIDIKPDTKTVRIEYASLANPQSPALNWLTALATDGDKEPFLYTLCEPDRTRDWIPIQDTPALRVTYDARIRVPSGLLAVMSAQNNPTSVRSDGVYDFTMSDPIPPYLIALAVGRMEFHPLSERTGFYAEPENVADGIHDLAYLPNMLAAAERVLGPYPFDRYDIVAMPPNFHAGGMENPNANFINISSCIPGNNENELSSVVAHEMAHSWTGDLVTCATWNDTWLNEGFASYFAGRILEEMNEPERGELEYYFARTNYADFVRGARTPESMLLHRDYKPTDSPGSSFGTASYSKGALFLKMIEDTVGRPAFDAFIAEWLRRNGFHWADDRAFIALLQERFGSFDLNYAEWIYGVGMPSNVTAPATAAIWTRAANAASALASGQTLVSLGAASWSPAQRDIFMWAGFSTVTTHMAEVDATFHMTSKKNASINWWVAMAQTRYAPAMPSFERFLMRGGGNVVGVYQKLAATPEGKKYAVEIYQKARPNYDYGTQAAIDGILYSRFLLRDAA